MMTGVKPTEIAPPQPWIRGRGKRELLAGTILIITIAEKIEHP